MTTHKGMRVLVTAGAGGIGRSIAQALAAAGANVHVCDVDLQGLQELNQAEPGISTSVCDVADRQAVGGMVVEAAVATLGGLDVLVNNAGIASATVADLPPNDSAYEALGTSSMGSVCRLFRARDSKALSSGWHRLSHGLECTTSSHSFPCGGQWYW